MGYIPLGMVFGFLFVQAGGPVFLAIFASVFIYAGASQFALVPMMAAGLPIASLALAALVINLRHIFYGLSLLERMPHSLGSRLYLMFSLTDETYSSLTTLPNHTTPKQMVALAAINHGWWITGTVLGAWLGSHVTVPFAGLDFALAALFAVLTVEQWRATQTLWPIALGLLAYTACYWIQPSHALVMAIAVCAIVGWFSTSDPRHYKQHA